MVQIKVIKLQFIPMLMVTCIMWQRKQQKVMNDDRSITRMTCAACWHWQHAVVLGLVI